VEEQKIDVPLLENDDLSNHPQNLTNDSLIVDPSNQHQESMNSTSSHPQQLVSLNEEDLPRMDGKKFYQRRAARTLPCYYLFNLFGFRSFF